MKVCSSRYFLFVCLVALAAFVLPARAFSAESVIRMKYVSFMPPTHPISVLSDQWCKELEKRTNGRVKAAFFPAGTLVSAIQIYDSVVKGVADIGFGIMSYTPGRMPLSEFIVLPNGYKSGAQASRMSNAFYKKFKPKEFDDVKVFYLTPTVPAFFHTKKLVQKIEDLKGLRIKGDGNTSKVIAASGATPTTMPMLETYDGIKRGLADGVLNPMETLKGWKFSEVCKYTYVNHGSIVRQRLFRSHEQGVVELLTERHPTDYRQAQRGVVREAGETLELGGRRRGRVRQKGGAQFLQRQSGRRGKDAGHDEAPSTTTT